jgi:large subunit ribosomal protein L10e
MRLAFGKAVGTAARVAPKQKIFTVYTTEQYIDRAKEAVRRGGYKLPSPSRMVIEYKARAA